MENFGSENNGLLMSFLLARLLALGFAGFPFIR
jgi:hypothetical protein